VGAGWPQGVAGGLEGSWVTSGFAGDLGSCGWPQGLQVASGAAGGLRVMVGLRGYGNAGCLYW
jgi:hypothetical protein